MKFDAEKIMVVAIIAMCMLHLYFYDINQGWWWDEAVFLDSAKLIANGEGYILDQFRPPLFPHLLSLFMFSGTAVKLIPPLFSVMSVIAIYYLGKALYSRQAGLLSALFLSSSHLFIFFTAKIFGESVFVFLMTMSILFFYSGIRKDERLFLLAGLFAALSLLTRYTGLILVPLFGMMLIVERKHLKSKWLWAGVFVFVVSLYPWLSFCDCVYSSPFGCMEANFRIVEDTAGFMPDAGNWTYYLDKSVAIFGFAFLLMVPAVFFMQKERKLPDKLMLSGFVLCLVFLACVARKEIKYAVSFFPIFYTFIGYGAYRILYSKDNNGKEKIKAVPSVLILSILLIAELSSGISLLYDDYLSGSAQREAAEYLKSEGVSKGTFIMTENYPVFHYVTEAGIIKFSDMGQGFGEVDEDSFRETVYNKSVEYVIIDKFEPTYPDFINASVNASERFDFLSLEKVVKFGGEDAIWIYRVV